MRMEALHENEKENAMKTESVSSVTSVQMRLLRLLLRCDAIVLAFLGISLVLMPKGVQQAFQFKELPEAVSYMIGLWGCVLLTMAIGYWVAASNPLRHVVWIQVGIARGALECILGLIYLSRGIVTWQQSGTGILVAALITLAFAALYPRQPQVVKLVADSTEAKEI